MEKEKAGDSPRFIFWLHKQFEKERRDRRLLAEYADGLGNVATTPTALATPRFPPELLIIKIFKKTIEHRVIAQRA